MEGNWCVQQFEVGDRVRFRPAGRWAGFKETLDAAARVTGIRRNRYGRVSYDVLFDAPVERKNGVRPHAKKARPEVETYTTLTAELEDLWPDGDTEPDGGW